MNRKLLAVLALALAGLAGLIIIFLRSADGDVSLTGPALTRSAAETPDAPAVLPVAVGDAASTLQAFGGDVGGLLAEAARVAALAIVRGGVSGRLVDAAGAAVAGEPVWLAVNDDRWEPDPQNSRLPRVAGRSVSGADGAFRFAARAGVNYDLHAGGQRWPATVQSDVHAGDMLVVTMPPPAVLEGTVVDGQSLQPVEGARLLVVQTGGNVLADAKSDGSFRITPLPPQELMLVAWAPGYDVKLSGNITPGGDPVRMELPPGRTVKGLLIDRGTEKPLAGGAVQLVMESDAALAGGDPVPFATLVQSRDAVVGPDGHFVFEGAPSAGFQLVCTSDGYLPEKYDRYRDRPLDATEEVVVPMFAEGELSGRAVVAASGAAAEGAQLVLGVPDGDLASTAADSKGAFTLKPPGSPAEKLLERPLFVSAHAPGLAARARPAGGRNREDLLLQLVPVLPLSVQVLDGGKPVQGAEVAARSQGSQTVQGVTDANGLVALVHEVSGPDVDRVSVQARRADVESLPTIVDPHAPPTGTLTIDLQAGAWLAGLVTDAAGTPVPAALVATRPADRNSPDPRRSVHADAQGHYRVGPLPAQVPYRVSVSADGFIDRNFNNILADAGALDVVLSPVVRWQGRALADAAGTPMRDFSGQLVELTKNKDGSVRERNTGERLRLLPDDPGGFSFDMPGPGRFLVRLWSRDVVPAASDPCDFDGTRAPPSMTLVLLPAAMLELTVLDGRGRPVPGFAVAAAPWALAEKAAAPSGDVRKAAVTARTDDSGVARLNLGAGGAFRVAGGPGLWLDDGSVNVQPGANVARLYRLPPTADLEVEVRDEQGNPIAGANVEVRSSKDEKINAVSRRARTGPDGDGSVVVEALPPGSYDVVARRRGYATVTKSATLAGNAVDHLSFVLPLSPQTGNGQGGGGPGGGGPGGGGPGGWNGGGWNGGQGFNGSNGQGPGPPR